MIEWLLPWKTAGVEQHQLDLHLMPGQASYRLERLLVCNGNDGSEHYENADN